MSHTSGVGCSQETSAHMNHASQTRSPKSLQWRNVDFQVTGREVISTTSRIHQSTVREMVYKRKRLNTVAPPPGSRCPAKMSPKAPHGMFREVEKNPGVTGRGLEDSFHQVQVCVHGSTLLDFRDPTGTCPTHDTTEDDAALQNHHCLPKVHHRASEH